MSNRLTRINKVLPICHAVSKKIMVVGDSLSIVSYMKSASSVSPVQQLNRWPDLVANALGSQFDEALCGDGIALIWGFLPVNLTKSHTVDSGDYGGQLIKSTNNNLNYWWDSETMTWKAVGGSVFTVVSKQTEWAAMIANQDVNIVFFAITGINDYGEWSARQALAKGAYGSPKMFYQRMKQMIIEVLNAGKTPFIVTNLTAFDATFHGRDSDYYKTGGYAAKARQLAVEYNITWADAGTRLAIEAALGRPDFNARIANSRPTQYATDAEWNAIINTISDPETATAYVAPFTDSYRDTAGKVMVDETLDAYHDGTIGIADSDRQSFFANQHLNFWGQKIVADEILNIIEEYGFGYSDFDFSGSDNSTDDEFVKTTIIQSNFDVIN